MIDFHTHILPKMDDGSKSTEESIAMLKMQAEQGIRWVVATPHFYAEPESPQDFLQRRKGCRTSFPKFDWVQRCGILKESVTAVLSTI